MYEGADGNLHLRLEHDIPAFETALLFFALPKLWEGSVSISNMPGLRMCIARRPSGTRFRLLLPQDSGIIRAARPAFTRGPRRHHDVHEYRPTSLGSLSSESGKNSSCISRLDPPQASLSARLVQLQGLGAARCYAFLGRIRVTNMPN